MSGNQDKMSTLADFLLTLTPNALKGILTCPDKKLLQFIFNVCANATQNQEIKYSNAEKRKLKKFEKDIIKLAEKKFPLTKKKSILRKRGHLFVKQLIKPHLEVFRGLI